MVPLRAPLDKGNTGTFRGVGDNDVRFTFLLQPFQGRHYRRHVVALAFGDRHPEGLPFVGQRIGIHDFARRPRQLEIVLVINNDEIIKAVVRRGQRRFPVAAFRQLAIAGN